jgi:hypothetical protein
MFSGRAVYVLGPLQLGTPADVLLGTIYDPQWGVDLTGNSRWYPTHRVRRGLGAQGTDIQSLTHIKSFKERLAGLWSNLVQGMREELEGVVVRTLARRGIVSD